MPSSWGLNTPTPFPRRLPGPPHRRGSGHRGPLPTRGQEVHGSRAPGHRVDTWLSHGTSRVRTVRCAHMALSRWLRKKCSEVAGLRATGRSGQPSPCAGCPAAVTCTARHCPWVQTGGWLWGQGLRALRLLPSRDKELPGPSPREAKVRARPGPRAGRGGGWGQLSAPHPPGHPRASPQSPVPALHGLPGMHPRPGAAVRGGTLCLPGSSGSRGGLDAARAPTSRGWSLTCGPRLSSSRNSARRPGAWTNV